MFVDWFNPIVDVEEITDVQAVKEYLQRHWVLLNVAKKYNNGDEYFLYCLGLPLETNDSPQN